MKNSIKILMISNILLCGCASSSLVSSTGVSDQVEKQMVTVGQFTCQKEIELTEGDSASYKNYCKLSTGDKFSVSPETVDTKKAGSKNVDLTLTDSDGNVTFTTVTLKVKAKATPTPEPTPTPEATEEAQEETKENTSTQTQNRRNNTSSSSNQSTYVAPQQPQAQPQQPATSQENTQSSESYEAEDAGGIAPGAPSGSTYDDFASCNAAAGQNTHTCTMDGATRKYVLTY